MARGKLVYHHRGTGTGARMINHESLSPIVKHCSLWVSLYSTDLPSPTLLTGLGQPKLSPTPSKFLVFKTGMLGCPAIV